MGASENAGGESEGRAPRPRRAERVRRTTSPKDEHQYVRKTVSSASAEHESVVVVDNDAGVSVNVVGNFQLSYVTAMTSRGALPGGSARLA